MYNRYIPQPDGSFRKTKLPEPSFRESCREAPPQFHSPCHVTESAHRECSCNEDTESIGSFLKNLIPRGLDTEDLIVVLLLLLLAQDKGKDGNQALLTLGAYLFL